MAFPSIPHTVVLSLGIFPDIETEGSARPSQQTWAPKWAAADAITPTMGCSQGTVPNATLIASQARAVEVEYTSAIDSVWTGSVHTTHAAAIIPVLECRSFVAAGVE